MLFPYTYVPHQMEKMHRFINFIFYQVWCRAPKTGAFGLNLFDANPMLKEVMTSFAYDDTQAARMFDFLNAAVLVNLICLAMMAFVVLVIFFTSDDRLRVLYGIRPEDH
jgi:hypothetical protein